MNFLSYFCVLTLLVIALVSASSLKNSLNEFNSDISNADLKLVTALDEVRQDNSLNLIQKQQKINKIVRLVFANLTSELNNVELLSLGMMLGERLKRMPSELIQKMLENDVTSYELIGDIKNEIANVILNLQDPASVQLNTGLTDDLKAYFQNIKLRNDKIRKENEMPDNVVNKISKKTNIENNVVNRLVNAENSASEHGSASAPNVVPESASNPKPNPKPKSSIDETMEYIIISNIFQN